MKDTAKVFIFIFYLFLFFIFYKKFSAILTPKKEFFFFFGWNFYVLLREKERGERFKASKSIHISSCIIEKRCRVYIVLSENNPHESMHNFINLQVCYNNL